MTPDATAPLNVSSHAEEEVGRLLSNFAATPFVLDGAEYASVEGFYSSLFWPEDHPGRALAAAQCGARAKRARPHVDVASLSYAGTAIGYRSAEHLALIERAIRAKIAAHPAIARRLAATADRPIIHVLHGVSQDAALCEILMRIRSELQATPNTGQARGVRGHGKGPRSGSPAGTGTAARRGTRSTRRRHR